MHPQIKKLIEYNNIIFDEQGNRTGNQVFRVNATVGVDEITSKANRVKVLENQSTF